MHGLENKIEEFQSNMISEVQDEINEFKNLPTKSLAALDLKKWQVKRRLEDLRNDILNLVKTFESKSEILITIFRMENAFVTMIDMYGRIENYIQQMDFANFVASMSQNEHAIGIPIENQREINELRKTIQRNIIIKKCIEIINRL